MSVNFPASLDDAITLPDPSTSSNVNNPSHAGLHDNENAAIIAVETKIGTGSSTPTSGKVLRATGTGTSTWGAVVLTTDVTGVLPVANGGTGLSSLGSGIATFLGTPSSANLASAVTDETGTGKLVFATSPSITTSLKDTNGNTWINQTAAPSAVNYVTIADSATGSPPAISASGSDINIDFNIATKGTGVVKINGSQIGPTAFLNPYKFSVYRNGALTDSNGAYALLTYDTKTFDTGSNYSTSTGKFTAPVAGFYMFHAEKSSPIGNTGNGTVALYVNGVLTKVGTQIYSGASGTTVGVGVTGLLQLAANDYVQVYTYGGGGAIATGAAYTYFDGFLMSAT